MGEKITGAGTKTGATPRRMPRFGTSTAKPKAEPKRISKKTQQSLVTRRRILDSAETLFAGHGYYGVTIREVAKAARIDTSLLHYHFGNKDLLFDQVIARRAEVANRMRTESLDAYEAACGGKVTLEGVIQASMSPLLELRARGGPGWKRYCSLLAQISCTPGWGGPMMSRHFDPPARRLIDLLHRASPETPMTELYWGYQLAWGALMLALADTGRIEPLSDGTVSTDNVAALAPRMLCFTVSGVEGLCKPKP